MPCEIWLKTEIISSALSFGEMPLPSGAILKLMFVGLFWLVLKLSLCPSFKSFVMNFLAWRRNSTKDLNESQI